MISRAPFSAKRQSMRHEEALTGDNRCEVLPVQFACSAGSVPALDVRESL